MNNVRLIQGDGVNEHTIRCILGSFAAYGWSADNIAFGMGGALLQQLDRDTQKFAMKCSAISVRVEDRKMTSAGVVVVDEIQWRDVQKDPITDSGKKSKAGRVTLWKSGDEFQSAVTQPAGWTDKGIGWSEALEEVYRDGKLVKDITFAEVRANACK